MPFSLTGDPSPTDISDAINYLLNNFGSNVSIDVNTGIVAGPSGGIGYLYKYLDIKYATSYDGSVGFSNSPTGATYYGSRNNNSSVESTNPADYIWTSVTGGFGTTKFIWYATSGGRQINVIASATSPGTSYLVDPGTAIDLDVVTGTNALMAALPAIYQWTSGSAPARPTTTSTYTWSTASFTPPSGWYSSIPSDTTPGDTLWAIYIPLVVLANTATSILDWTNTSYAIVQIAKNGSTGTTGATGLSALTAYLQQSQSAGIPSYTTPNYGNGAPSGWSLTAPTPVVGNTIWIINGQYNGSSGTISGVPAGYTAWTGPLAVSVFQDIESDNWNGGTPPTSGPYSPLGTAGYYIQRATGNMYLNSVYGRGVAQFDGANSGISGVSAAMLANKSLGQSTGVEAYSNNSFLTSGALRAWNSSGGNGNAIYANQNGTGVGVLAQSTSGTGVKATGDTGLNGIGVSVGVTGSGVNGVYGSGSSAGVYGSGGTYGLYGSGTYGAYSNGPFGTSSNSYVNNLYGQYSINLVGQASGTLLYFYTGPTTGSGTATFNPANKPGASTTNTWIEVVIGGTSYQIPVWAS
jgi:hypothetical protein